MAGEAAADPGFGKEPVALDSGGRDVQHVSGPLDAEAGEVARFDDLCLLRIEGLQFMESAVKVEQVDRVLALEGGGIGPVGEFGAAAPFLNRAGAAVIDQDSPLDAGSDDEEMSAVRIVQILFSGEAEVGLVDDGGALKCLAGHLLSEIAPGDAAQLGVDDFDEAVEGIALTGIPAAEQAGDVRLRGIVHQRFRALYRPAGRRVLHRETEPAANWGGSRRAWGCGAVSSAPPSMRRTAPLWRKISSCMPAGAAKWRRPCYGNPRTPCGATARRAILRSGGIIAHSFW